MERLAITKHKIDRKAKAIRSAFSDVFGDQSSQVADLDMELEGLENEFKLLEAAGSFDLPIIGIFGANKVGKSWLARLFLTCEEDRREILSGEDSANVTRQLQAFGKSIPEDLKEGMNFCRTSGFYALGDAVGTDYVIIDAPGSTDADPSLSARAREVQSRSTLKLFVVEFEQMRGEEVLGDLSHGAGSLVLPVILYEGHECEGMEEEASQHIQRWKKKFPGSRIHDQPIWMPKVNSTELEGEAADDPEAYTRKQLQQTIPAILGDRDDRTLRASGEMEAKFQKVLDLLDQRLTSFRKRVCRPFESLLTARESLPGDIITEILGKDEILHAGMRIRFRAEWLGRIPALCFPFKTVSGTVALAAGAWDKLIFAAFGSLPSLGMVLFQMGKTLKDNFSKHKTSDNDNALKEILESKIRDSLGQKMAEFEAALRSCLGFHDREELEGPATKISFEGLDNLIDAADQSIDDTVHQCRAKGKWANALAVVPCLLFAYLVCGPVYSVYMDYHKVLLGNYQTTDPVWQAFPTPPFKLLAISFLLAILPVSFFAMIGVWMATKQKRLEDATEVLKKRFKAKVYELLGSRKLKVGIDDKRINAVQFLLDIGKREESTPFVE